MKWWQVVKSFLKEGLRALLPITIGSLVKWIRERWKK